MLDVITLAATLSIAIPQDDASGDGPAAAALTEDVGILRPGPAPLLREGDVITRGIATMHREENTANWLIRVRSADPAGRSRDLIALPCSLLDEMVRMVTSRPDQQVVFEITGEVYVFESRNYFLPTHAPHLAGYEDAEPASPAPPDEPEDDPADDEAGDDEPRAGDRAADLIRSIESRTGPLAMTSGDDNAIEGADAMREETIVTWRRGRVTRDSLGAWLVVFDADAEGRADPPMVILPCLLLERLGRHAQGGRYTPVLISGRVYTYRGRNYLMPSVYRVPRERTDLTP